jgi:hypothetical protein
LNLDVLPNLLRGFAGWEASPAAPYRAPWRQALNLDVLPNLLRGFVGWEASPASPYRAPWSQALNLDVLPALLRGFVGWETSPVSPYRAPWLQALNLDVLPNLLRGFAGWEASPAAPYRAPWLQAANLDVLPNLLLGFTGWEASPAAQYRAPWLQALNLDVLPNLLRGFADWEASPAAPYRAPWSQAANYDVYSSELVGRGWEAYLPPQYRIPRPRALNLEVFPSRVEGQGWEAILPPQQATRRLVAQQIDALWSAMMKIGPWFYFPETPRPYQVPFIKVGYEDLFPQPSNLSHIEVEPILPPQYKIPPLQALNLDVLPNVQLQVIYPYSPDIPDVALRFLHPLWIPSDDFWPGLVVPPTPSRLGVGGGEYVCETEEDINRRECLEKTIQAIDGELAEIERKSREEGTLKIIEPEVMPPDWKAGDDDEYGPGYWYEPKDPRTYGRPVRPRQQDRTGRDPVRHVHYNFAADLDFGVRRRIIGILDRAEHRGARIFGSDAFVTKREAKVAGTLVVPGTNAWVVRLGAEERLIVAKEAIAEGFRLVSYDDTSLSFIHRQTYPWKTLFLGAAVGASIMGAGVYTGYLIWGRPKTLLLPEAKPTGTISKPGRKPRK